MPVFKKNGISVLYIHIPKAGGTTIENTFVKSGFEMTYRRGGAYGPFNDFDKRNKCSPQHMHAELLDAAFDPLAFDYVFTVTRHPLERFVSEYRFRRSHDHKAVQGSISEFFDHVQETYPKHPFMLDNHLRPQVEFLWADCDVFRLEDGLTSVFERISAVTGVEIEYEDLVAMKSSSKIKASLDASLERDVRKFYASDFESLEYD